MSSSKDRKLNNHIYFICTHSTHTQNTVYTVSISAMTTYPHQQLHQLSPVCHLTSCCQPTSDLVQVAPPSVTWNQIVGVDIRSGSRGLDRSPWSRADQQHWSTLFFTFWTLSSYLFLEQKNSWLQSNNASFKTNNQKPRNTNILI